jgi:sulfur-carrier protein
MGTFRVQLFAGLRDAAGVDSLQIVAPQITKASDLIRELENRHPELIVWLRRSRLAVNQRFVTPDDPVDNAAEIALIPPVSGG